ncbi:MAG: transaldolase family protein [Patescibacteria group bacterium]|nr:transaldolase family protein [Patescibacteria group bacterium]
MKPVGLKTKIFLDSGDSVETAEILGKLGFLDGQTTNPSLIAKSPESLQRLKSGDKFTAPEVTDFYQTVIQKVATIIPQGSISIEVYADEHTSAEAMIEQAKSFSTWTPRAQIKFPITTAGLQAAAAAVAMGLSVNMTLCFTQQQAAAVYAATAGAVKGQVYLSPFVGRLDDSGQNGIDLIKNIIQMYSAGDGHVEVLAASVRTMDHFFSSIKLGADIITAPSKILNEWSVGGLNLPPQDFVYHTGNLQPLAYEQLSLTNPWQEYDLNHPLTAKGLAKFAEDWNSIIKK